jgi:hypothetical protein
MQEACFIQKKCILQPLKGKEFRVICLNGGSINANKYLAGKFVKGIALNVEPQALVNDKERCFYLVHQAIQMSVIRR